jgi:hypothetical protein
LFEGLGSGVELLTLAFSRSVFAVPACALRMISTLASAPLVVRKGELES